MNFGYKQTIEKHKNISSTPRKLTTKVLMLSLKAFLLSIVVLVIIVGFTGLGMIKGIIDNAPSVEDINIAPVGQSTIIYDSNEKEIGKLITSGSNRKPVEITQMATCLQNAFISIEDERFRDHNGIDIKGIIRAAFVAVSSGSFSEGASTITQQLLKNNVFENGGYEETLASLFKRKIQEQYLALELEKVMTKDIILQNYLNTINLGAGCYGVEAACLRYFNKSANAVTVSESAVIAAITQNPTKYNPINHPDANAERRLKVLNNMLKNGHITQTEYDEALTDDVYARIQTISVETDDSNPYTYFTDELISQVLEDLQEQKAYTYTQACNALYTGGLKIYSTQDSTMQKICDEEMTNDANYPADINYSFSWAWTVKHADGTTTNYSNINIVYYHTTLLSEPAFKLIFDTKEEAQACIDEFKKAYIQVGDIELGENVTFTPQPQASLTVIDQKTGYVKALVGGRGEKTASLSLNRATDTYRQPGSLFKVLSTFAPAMDSLNYTLASVEDDAPYSDSTGRPITNWWGAEYRGLSSIRDGIRDSMNIVAVKFIEDITPQLGFDYLKNFGFTSLVSTMTTSDGRVLTDIGLSLALGGITKGVSNIETCAAFSAIANGGVYTEPVYYTKVLDANGRVLLDKTANTHTVIKESTAWLLSSAMRDVITSGSATAARVAGQYVVGKSGTTQDNNDIWFAGSSNYITTTIWAGYDENQDVGWDTQFQKRIWGKVMARIHEAYGWISVEPEPIDSIVTAQICSVSGKLAVPGLCDKDPSGTSTIVTEYFAKGTIPTETCDCHAKYTICLSSGLLASPNCPADKCVTKIYRVRPEGSVGTTLDSPYCLPTSLLNTICILKH